MTRFIYARALRLHFYRSASASLRPPRPPRWILLLFLATLLSNFPASAFAQDAPILKIDEDCAAFAFAPDGRIAYAVRRIHTVRRIDMQRDDIWVTTLDGKKKRIVNGEKLVQGSTPFSFAIQSLAWSPDGHTLTVEMFTSQMIDERGNTRESLVTLLLEEDGKEIKIRGGDSIIPEASDATWLGDGVTVAYLSEAVKPRLLFGINIMRPIAGRGEPLFEGSLVSAVVWDPAKHSAIAVERDAKLQEPPKLVHFDLQKQTRRLIATLPGYLGNLVVSRSGKRVAYYADNENIEVRDLDEPSKVTRVRITYGSFIWGPDDSRLLFKRGTAKRSADLSWIRLPGGQVESILSGLTFRDFQISPDGKFIAVTVPGKRILHVFPLP